MESSTSRSDWKMLDWKVLVTRNYSLYYNWLFLEGDLKHEAPYHMPSDLEYVDLGRGAVVTINQSARTMQVSFDRVIQNVMEREGYGHEIKVVTEHLGRALIESATALGAEGSGVKEFRAFSDAWARLAPSLKVCTFIGRACYDLFLDRLEKIHGLSRTQAELSASTLTLPDETTPSYEQEIAFLTLVGQAQRRGVGREDPQIAMELQKQYLEYRYIPVNFIDEPWTRAHFESQFDLMHAQGDAHERLEAVHAHRRKALAARDSLQQSMNLNASDTRLLLALREGTYLNEYRKSVFSKSNLLARAFFERQAQKAGMSSYLDLLFMAPDEITLFLESGRLPSELAERHHAFGLMAFGGEVRFMTKTELADAHALIKPPAPASTAAFTGVLRGVIGSRGSNPRVVGKAKIVMTATEGAAKFATGDILVAKMTSVDFVPLMRRARAFVTDEGGITCHAAIVAREMDKPCIIGTKFGSRVLHDGDLIEVNTDNGTVTKI